MSRATLFCLGMVPAFLGALNTTASRDCTLFYAADGEVVLGGNNEDWHIPLTKLWFVPGVDGRHGVAYVTFADHRAIQGGVNDQGLFFDFLAVQPRDVKPTPDKERWNGHPLREVMEQCVTVDEAVTMLESHHREFMRRICIFLGDAHGNSAIVEAEAVVRKQGSYQVATNFRQSLTPPAQSGCRRYQTANRMLAKADKYSVELFRRICEAVHQEGNNSTLYSTVYDLTRKQIYLYHFHNYENVVVFDVEAELAKGEHVVEMPSLFPANPAFERFRQSHSLPTNPPSSDRPQRDTPTFQPCCAAISWPAHERSVGQFSTSQSPTSCSTCCRFADVPWSANPFEIAVGGSKSFSQQLRRDVCSSPKAWSRRGNLSSTTSWRRGTRA